ncbi:hypothetical protein [Sporobacter termitidis]|uniref:hypothetical protein n=1 Tax=Sporobacter termitidis TaxID=44749 RepID=UPI001160D642|nr:hypothetical protein [Sporobacter termitidis]
MPAKKQQNIPFVKAEAAQHLNKFFFSGAYLTCRLRSRAAPVRASLKLSAVPVYQFDALLFEQIDVRFVRTLTKSPGKRMDCDFLGRLPVPNGIKRHIIQLSRGGLVEEFDLLLYLPTGFQNTAPHKIGATWWPPV